MTNAPQFVSLDRAECEVLLGEQTVGRLAFAFRDRVDIEPIHFVYRHGWIYGRTRFGTKVNVLAHHPWVAFEVDDARALFEWRSVVVHGHIEFPDPSGSPLERERHAHAVEVFRELIPGAFTESDPTPGRDLVFAISAQEVIGRAARPRTEAS